MSDKDNKGTIERFDGWIITCPHCKHRHPSIRNLGADDVIHVLICEECDKEFEL